jgi:folate-binding protein YgfZ
MTNEYSNCESTAVSNPELSVIRMTGEDRATFLHSFCTADIKKLQPGQCCEAFFLNHKGKTNCHGIVVCREIDLLIVSTAPHPNPLLEDLDKYLLSQDVQLSEVSKDWRSVFVFGPEHESALSKCGVDVPVEGAVSIVGFQVVLQAELAGQGVLLLEPAAGDVDMAKQLIDNGAKELSQTQMHWERIANNTPWCGSEVNDSCLVQEFRRDDKAVSFTKGCYLGQETVARLDALGHVNRYLFGFEVVDGAVAAGDELRKDGKKVGVVSSVADVDSRNAIGLGFVKVELAKPGDELQCENVTLKVRS